MADSILDAAGRTVCVGDTVGGVTSSRHHTVVGLVVEIATDRVRIDPAGSTSGTPRPELDDGGWIPASRMFFVGHQVDEALLQFGIQVAESGPSLFYVTPMEADVRTITRIDQSAPHGLRDRFLCRALIIHALDVLDRHERTEPTAVDAPTIIYAASDKATVTRVDQNTVIDPRERSLCRGLLNHALYLCTSEPVTWPLVPETGEAR